MSLNDKAREFAEEVKKTREFIELRQARAKIDKDREMKARVDGFIKKQAEVFAKGGWSRETEARVAELNREFDSLLKVPDVDRFVKAGKRFNDMMLQVNKSVAAMIESGLKGR